MGSHRMQLHYLQCVRVISRDELRFSKRYVISKMFCFVCFIVNCFIYGLQLPPHVSEEALPLFAHIKPFECELLYV